MLAIINSTQTKNHFTITIVPDIIISQEATKRDGLERLTD